MVQLICPDTFFSVSRPLVGRQQCAFSEKRLAAWLKGRPSDLFLLNDCKDNNPASTLTKNRSSKEWFALLESLLKPLLVFWRSDNKNPDGTADGSHLVKGSDAQQKDGGTDMNGVWPS